MIRVPFTTRPAWALRLEAQLQQLAQREQVLRRQLRSAQLHVRLLGEEDLLQSCREVITRGSFSRLEAMASMQRLQRYVEALEELAAGIAAHTEQQREQDALDKRRLRLYKRVNCLLCLCVGLLLVQPFAHAIIAAAAWWLRRP